MIPKAGRASSTGGHRRPLHEDTGNPPEPDRLPGFADDDDGDGPANGLGGERSALAGGGPLRDDIGEQEDFRDRFDEDLYNDREDHPAQGNTADFAMGEQRFGSEADAYTEYAWRRPGDHHRGEESAVGQARDPSDIASEDEKP